METVETRGQLVIAPSAKKPALFAVKMLKEGHTDSEMIDFVNSMLTVEGDLIIAVYWIGYHVKPKDFEQF